MFSTKIWTNYVKLQGIFINIGAKKYEFDNVESCRNIVDICEYSSINFCKNAKILRSERCRSNAHVNVVTLVKSFFTSIFYLDWIPSTELE